MWQQLIDYWLIYHGTTPVKQLSLQVSNCDVTEVHFNGAENFSERV